MEKQSNNSKELSSFLVILLAVIVISFVVGGGIFYWQSQALKKVKEELKQELAREEVPTLTPTPTLMSDLSPAVSSDLTPTLTPVDKYAGWLTYTNNVYNYRFKYPVGASIEEAKKEAFSLTPEEVSAGMTFKDKYNKYTGKICISLTYKLGYVQISAPANKDFAHVICGRTGRAYEGPDRSEALTIDGKNYTATGFEEKGPGETLNFHNETMVVTLDDGTRIEYGSRSDPLATFADYQNMREEIMKIVESYRKI